LENPALKCKTCGMTLRVPDGQTPAAFVEEESGRCTRVREIVQQRQTLSLKLQAGIVGMLGSDAIDTVDLVAHRRSLAQLDAALANEARELGAAMLHKPEGL
jgi:hypothetical protein